MLGSSALFVALAAAVSTCPLPAPTGQGFAQFTALEAELRAAQATAPKNCRSALNLALGTTLVRMGVRAAEAAAPLTEVIETDPDLRGAALLQLGLAQALAGDQFEALRALAEAQRRLGPGSPEAAAALDAATLLVRLRVRRGGSAWSAHRFDAAYPLYRDRQLEGPLRLAAHGDEVLVLSESGLLRIGDDAERPIAPLTAAPRGFAVMADGRAVVLLKNDLLLLADGTTAQLTATVGRLDARAIAYAVDDRLYVLDSGGQLNICPAGGGDCEMVPKTRPIEAFAADGRGGLHVLQRGDASVAVLDASGTVLRTLEPFGPGWEWRRIAAIAADRFGGTYLLSAEQGVVYLFDPTGAYCGRLDPPVDDPKRLQRGRSLAVTADGSVYVLVDRNVVRYR